MLTFNFTRIFKVRGINKPFSYLIKLGYSPSFATRITNNRSRRLDLAEIEKLCELLRCTPNDLIEWTPGNNDAANDTHPLMPLMRKDKVAQLTQILNSASIEKLNEIESILRKEMDLK